MSLAILLLVPIICAVAIFFVPLNLKTLNRFHVIFSAIISTVILANVAKFVVTKEIVFAFDKILFLDSLGSIFLILIAITGFLANAYATTYLKWEHEEGHFSLSDIRKYYFFSYIFIFTMSLSTICNNMAFLWAAVEATTLASVFMVAVHKDKKSTESGYKYIVLCSIGLAFALYATVLLYSSSFAHLQNSDSAILFTSLLENVHLLDQKALKLVFVLALIGYGTKAGLVPTHTWLPDVHAEGPAPTSAMLSGILLKCALLALVRFYALAGQAVGADFVQNVMIISGTLTLFVSAFFLIRQHNVKRMFAYHSIAHMGVIAFALGVGGFWGVFAALFHCLAHSFTKALAFCSTGNIAKIYGTKDMTKMGNMIHIAPLTTVLFGIAICSLVGVPGFAIFVSEFMTFKAAVLGEKFWAIGIFALALCIIFIADFSHFFLASFGKVNGVVKYDKEMELKENLPLIALAFLIVAFGVWQFDSFKTLLDMSSNLIIGKA